jgi:hypothetical protein
VIRFASLLDMKYFTPVLLVLSILYTTAIAQNTEFISRGKAFNGLDRTITWRPWQQSPENDALLAGCAARSTRRPLRFRIGDRYLGRGVWEHYLGFEQNRSSSNAVKLSMIRLGNEDAGEDAVLRPGSRYAIFKVMNSAMTARKRVWSWTAQEVR